MNRFNIVLKNMLLVAILFQSIMATAQEHEAIHFCESLWSPYTYGSLEKAPERGYAVDIFNEISRRINTSISTVLLPWKRCLLMTKQGKKDGIMLLTKNKEREGYLAFTDALTSDSNLLWFRDDQKLDKERLNSFEDLKEYRIGVVQGFNYGEDFKHAITQHQLVVEPSHDIKSNFHKLSLGRIDVFLVNFAAANEVLKMNPNLKGKFKYVDRLFERLSFHIALSKQSKAIRFLPAFNQAIADMHEDGTIDKILR